MPDKIKNILTENPHYLGLIIAFLGLLGLICAIVNANWLYGDVNKMTYNMKKIDGWVNFFGRKTARVISGVISVVIIAAGLFWFIAASK
jgi:hypothetical protein